MAARSRRWGRRLGRQICKSCAFVGWPVQPIRPHPSMTRLQVLKTMLCDFMQVDRSKDTLFFASEQSLGYLDGSAPADYGFDPLGLSDPDGAGGFIDPKWLSYR